MSTLLKLTENPQDKRVLYLAANLCEALRHETSEYPCSKCSEFAGIKLLGETKSCV